jgi:uncharacterized membrane protein
MLAHSIVDLLTYTQGVYNGFILMDCLLDATPMRQS